MAEKYVTQTEAIRLFLAKYSPPDLASLYGANMEVQVEVDKGKGHLVEGVTETGHVWRGYSDNIQTWKNIRIPYAAATNPNYTEKRMSWDLEEHAKGIGMTGWDWETKVSRWVGYDFDAMIGHSEKHSKRLSDEELARIKDVVCNVPWVTVRRSTGGRGLHLYVHLSGVATATHTEHAAMARAILGMLSAKTGYPLHTAVDACGAILWVWHKKYDKAAGGLELIKQGTVLDEIPPNWKDHLDVVSGKRKRSIPEFIREENRESLEKLFEELSGQNKKTELDAEHIALMNWLHDNNRMFWFDHDNHMLVTHTSALKDSMEELPIKGVFTTLASGSDVTDHNCFCYPLRNGGWAVRRYGPGVAETDTWQQDGQGWTRCYFNREADLNLAALTFNGVENKVGTFNFLTAEDADKAANMLGAKLDVQPVMSTRAAKLSKTKDDRLFAEIKAEPNDRPDSMKGWYNERGFWKKIFNIRKVPDEEKDVSNFDKDVRHLIANGESYGWAIKSNGWVIEPLAHVSIHLAGLGLKPNDIRQVQGAAMANPWLMVNKPFEPEYPGEREWNRGAVQFKYLPAPSGETRPLDAWEKVLTHCGEGLDDAIKLDSWCQTHGVRNGRDYLMLWVASMFQFPTEPLPYLFFYGPQGSGKSIFHEAISNILTGGVVNAGIALESQGQYNGELQYAILCYIEEKNLMEKKGVYNRVKELVTARKFLLHAKGKTPGQVTNTMHWVQCGNDRSYVPAFPGDTRIVITKVGPLAHEIPKGELEAMLIKEAPDFIRQCLDLVIPKASGRLRIPMIVTEDKKEAERGNMNPVEQFIDQECRPLKGNMVPYEEFWSAFSVSLSPSERGEWTKVRMGGLIPDAFPKGRSIKNNYNYVCNIALKSHEGDTPLVEDGKPGPDKLIQCRNGKLCYVT